MLYFSCNKIKIITSLSFVVCAVIMIFGCSVKTSSERTIVNVLKKSVNMEVQVRKDNDDLLVNIVKYGKINNMFYAAGLVATVVGKLQDDGKINEYGILAVYFPEVDRPGLRTDLSVVKKYYKYLKTNDEWAIQQMNTRMWEVIFSKTKPKF